MIRFLMPAAFVTLLLTSLAATAQHQRQDTPGQFDFYVLSLSWSPSFCAAAAERGRGSSGKCTVWCSTLFVRGAWPMAAI